MGVESYLFCGREGAGGVVGGVGLKTWRNEMGSSEGVECSKDSSLGVGLEPNKHVCHFVHESGE